MSILFEECSFFDNSHQLWYNFLLRITRDKNNDKLGVFSCQKNLK